MTPMTENMSVSEVGLYARETAVYRLYDDEKRLLYVGVTCDLAVRWAAHRLEKPWWPEVARREVVWRENRAAALREEAPT